MLQLKQLNMSEVRSLRTGRLVESLELLSAVLKRAVTRNVCQAKPVLRVILSPAPHTSTKTILWPLTF